MTKYVIPTKYAYTHYPRHFTKGKKYKVQGKTYKANTGLTLTVTPLFVYEVTNKNIVGGKLL